MSQLSLVSGTYDRHARLYPGLLTAAPLVAATVAVAYGVLPALESVAAVFIASGETFLLAQFARDAGRRSEAGLLEHWGGLPSVAIFRYRDNRLDAITKARYHAALARLVEGTATPSADEERTDPTAADAVYAAWSTYLRAHTRDTTRFALLFRENVNYGFRRNLWGLRPVGLVGGLLGALVSAASIVLGGPDDAGLVALVSAVVLGIAAVVVWARVVTRGWVRVPADAYAERLAESADTLIGDATHARII